MANITTAEANAILNASVAGGAYAEPDTTDGIKLALMTANGDEDTAGTEVVVGSSGYARQTITFGSAASGSITNSAAVNFTNMPAVASPGIVGVEILDSAGTPVRRWFGALEADKVINAGDTVTFNASSVTVSLG